MFEENISYSTINNNVASTTNINNSIMLRTNPLHENKAQLKLYSETIILSGAKGEIFTGKFSTEGFLFANGGYDRNVYVWEVFEERCRNLTTLPGHNNAILDSCWNQDDSKIYTCSADKTVCIWDLYEAKRIKKYKGHQSFVNSINSSRKGPELIVSGSDDCSIIVWDTRNKYPILTEKFKYQITSVCFNSNSDQIFIGSIDNQIKIYDIKKKEVQTVLSGHSDTITGLALSNDGNYLLSNSMDNSIRCWDIRSYVHNNSRFVKSFTGITHNFEKNLLKVSWSKDDSLISAGSADRFVYIWNFTSGKIEKRFGGHNGSVNETSFNNLSNVISSASSDSTVIIGEY
jgi:Prp8 binding protein